MQRFIAGAMQNPTDDSGALHKHAVTHRIDALDCKFFRAGITGLILHCSEPHGVTYTYHSAHEANVTYYHFDLIVFYIHFLLVWLPKVQDNEQ